MEGVIEFRYGSIASTYSPDSTPIPPSIYHEHAMAFPIKICAICSEEFELKPGKPGFANRCPDCSAPEADEAAAKGTVADTLKGDKGANEARREAMRNLLYRKDS
jgi:hypothetical protein